MGDQGTDDNCQTIQPRVASSSFGTQEAENIDEQVTGTHLLQMAVKLLHCLIVQNRVIDLIIGFTNIVLVKYVTDTHFCKQGILRLLSESGQN